jgi:hypothetical protein
VTDRSGTYGVSAIITRRGIACAWAESLAAMVGEEAAV